MKATRQQRQKLTAWGIPLAYTIGTLIVGMLIPRLEQQLLPDSTSSLSAASAMAICSSIASGMIALTGIVFALTFLMVQFSATAYSPRLVLWIARDPVMTHALGVFISTFLYALILLAWVDRSTSGRVPLISGWLIFVLLVVSMVMFIALIDRVGLLQVNRMLIFTGDQGRKAIDELYTSRKSLASSRGDGFRNTPLIQSLTHSGRPQVIQAIRAQPLIELASRAGAVIEAVAAVGDTVVERMPLLRVYGVQEPIDETQLRGAIEIGDERTFEQDPKYALRLVVDIAIKALSPAINDPTTAVQALDQIQDLLLRLGCRDLDLGRHCDASGTLRLVIPYPQWDDLLRLGFDEIRFCGANSVQVMRRMKALIVDLMAVLPADRHPALKHWEQRLQHTVSRTFSDQEEKRDALVPDRQGLGIAEEKADQVGSSSPPKMNRPT